MPGMAVMGSSAMVTAKGCCAQASSEKEKQIIESKNFKLINRKSMSYMEALLETFFFLFFLVYLLYACQAVH
jgi:hypothetical protein